MPRTEDKWSAAEQAAMGRALTLAWRGWGRVAPNPMVGAVLIRNDHVVGEGFHAQYGGPHAEVTALEACGAARGATCVVTLEPCAHHGKTPPCVDALLAAGVQRVVYGVGDPSPSGGGGWALRTHGLEVVAGLCAREAGAMNAPFFFAATHSGRPFVALKLATSLDGFLADGTGRSQWISGPEARAFVQWLRAGFDAIAVGRKTAQIDNPKLTVRGPVTPRQAPRRIVFSRSGAVSPNLEIVRTARAVPTLVLTGAQGAGVATAALAGSGARIVAADGLAQGLAALRETGIQSLLVEGGGELARALLQEDLVDRVYWIQAPVWLRSGVAAFGSGHGADLEDAHRWTPTERKSLGDDTLLVVDRELCLQGS